MNAGTLSRNRLAGMFAAGRTTMFALGLAVMVAGCSGQAGNGLTGPSAASPAGNPEAHTGGTNRHYKASMAPLSVGAGSSVSLAVTLTNCDETACPGNPTSSTGNQSIGSAEIVLPAGFTPTSVTSVSGSKSWSGSVVGNTIRLGATNGTQKLGLGESVTVTFQANSPSTCDTYTVTTNAYQDTLSSGNLVTTTPYVLVGPQPQVEVTGCEQAAGCSHGYWKNHQSAWQGHSPSDPLGGVFAGLAAHGLENVTLAAALDFGGGPTLTDAVKILLRNAVAAVLNAAHSGVDFPWTHAQVVTAVNNAIASADRATILELEGDLDDLNNLGCPLF